MMGKLVLFIIGYLFVQTLNAQVSKTLSIAPGTLSSILNATERGSITNLILTGTMDARDFKTMRDDMPVLSVVDLSAVTVVAYTGTEGTEGISSANYPADEIPDYAFLNSDTWKENTSLTSLKLPSTITTIGNYAFMYTIELTSIDLPSTVISIGENAFYGCLKLNLIHIPASVTTIRDGAFMLCNASIEVDANNLNYSAMDGVLFNKDLAVLINCPISKSGIYNIPSTVKSVETGAFLECVGLTSVTIPSSVDSIKYGAFQNCRGLTSVVIPSSITTIEYGTFQNCSGMNSVAIPASVDSIGSFAFYGCSGLTSVNIPLAVNLLGSYSFSGCTGLTSIILGNSIPIDLSSVTEVFTDVDKGTCKLYVPYQTSALYSTAIQWKDFTSIIELPAFTLSALTVGISAGEGSSATVDISSNVSWTAGSDKTWLTVTPGSGTGNGTLSFTASANSGDTRTALVTVAVAGVLSQVVTVGQAAGSLTQFITLNTGWNIISALVSPANADMKVIIQPLIDEGKLRKVMDESGKTIENFGAFGGWRNNIGNLNTSKGYKVNVTAAANLSITGTSVQLPLDIALNSGWNIISYPSSNPQDAKALFKTLIDAGKLKKVMDESGKTLENFGAFGGWKNNIGNLLPGKGYKVNVTSSCTLTIP